jgi:dTDP-4-amino-4,6-dideoxygalactose transaminase
VQPHLTLRTKAIVPVHLGGWPVDTPALMTLARDRAVAVIEDCAQAHGATVDGRPVGAFGDFAAFSFCQDKISTTGSEGVLLTMDDERWWREAWAFKDHGKSYEAIFERDHPPGFRYVYDSFGTNWRMLEIQAAIGRFQLRKLPEWHARRHAIGSRLDATLRELPALRVPVVPERLRHAYYRTYAYVRPEALRGDWDHQRIADEVSALNVPCYVGSATERYLDKAFREAGLGPAERLPVAREPGETSLCFLCHPTLTDEHVERAIEVVTEVVGRATR